MTSFNFFLGNVGRDGQLEAKGNEALEEMLLDSQQTHGSGASILQSVLGGILDVPVGLESAAADGREGGGGDDGGGGGGGGGGRDDADTEDGLLLPCDDAVDYADLSELADDEEEDRERSARVDGGGESGQEAADVSYLLTGEDAAFKSKNVEGFDIEEMHAFLNQGLIKEEYLNFDSNLLGDLAENLGLDLAQGPAVPPGLMDWKSGDHIFEEKKTAEPDDTFSKVDIAQMLFPTFKPNEVPHFSELFGSSRAELKFQTLQLVKECVPSKLVFETEVDEAILFRYVDYRAQKRQRIAFMPVRQPEEYAQVRHDSTNRGESTPFIDDINESQLRFICDDWEDRVVVSDHDEVPSNLHDNELLSAPLNSFFLNADWSPDIEHWVDPGRREPHDRIELNLNDPYLLVDQENEEPLKKLSEQESILDNLDLSNDRAYEVLKNNLQSKVRSQLSHLSIEHSDVAIRLQSPYYKAHLSKGEARSFHRPLIHFKPGTVINFSRIRKKLKDRKRKPSEVLLNTKDLSLSDNMTCLLLEHSEEYPCALSNFGMGSKIINYYRKMNAEDTLRPKREIGETHVLDALDKSPFWNFGTVNPGEIVPALYNRMFRAPIFRHDVASSDFLVVRLFNRANWPLYYLRHINYLYTVGQTFPSTEIPTPHSRKATMASKNRLKMITYRVLKKEHKGIIQIKDIVKHFSDQSEMQIRGRLKEFMEYQRNGEDQGYWKIKVTESLPPEKAIRGMITPELACVIESMQVGLRTLEDAGFSKTEGDEEDDSKLSIEQQLAPWNITRNFIAATVGKAMLMINGEGDPTGRGEGFSFVKTSMKGGFKPSGESIDEKLSREKMGHTYNMARQTQAYNEEITKVWNAQLKSLSAIGEQMDTETDNSMRRESRSPMLADSTHSTPRVENIAQSPADYLDREDDLISLTSQISSSANKVLKIIRTIQTSNGRLENRVEIVSDPHVIHAYVKRRRKIEAREVVNIASNFGPSDDAERNEREKRALMEELARLRRNHDRRLNRKAQKARQSIAAGLTPERLQEIKPATADGFLNPVNYSAH